MAMTSALMPSPTFTSAFSPYTDSPSSPAPYNIAYRGMQRISGGNENLAPPPSPYPATVEPSPVESTKSASTDTTDIEVDGEQDIDDVKSPDIELISPASQDAIMAPHLSRLDTDHSIMSRADDEPQSVIHAPATFRQFPQSLSTHNEEALALENKTRHNESKRSSLHAKGKSSPTGASERASSTATQRPEETESIEPGELQRKDTAPINTAVPPSRSGAGSTPRASTQEEAEAEWRRSGSQSSDAGDGETNLLKDSAEAGTAEIQLKRSSLQSASTSTTELEIKELRTALSECWTLCNTLEVMSSNHRQRVFNFSETGQIQEHAWRSCWTLCQSLYDCKEDDNPGHTKPILELCREFCQALFEARDRGDAIKDSILRVSFELNNHLYNTRNPNLPDAFTERTLDFYVTLCHRLIKDQTSLPEDTDLLIRGCWNLAECFFTFRERTRDTKSIDEETLSSAVQACWDLSDLFRERWSLLRPERGTPRPQQQQQRTYQTTTYSVGYSANQSNNSRPASALSAEGSYRGRDFFIQPLPPETPTTIYDDRDDTVSPADTPVPDILVIGHENPPLNARWSSNASVASVYSDNSQRSATNSSRTARGQLSRGPNSSQTSPKSAASSRDGSAAHVANLVGIKALVVKAALNKGFQRNNMSAPALQAFVRSVPPTAFGVEPWQRQMFEHYKRLILTDPFMQESHPLPVGRRFSALEIAYAVRWIVKNDHYRWLDALYELVFGFGTDQAEANNRGPGIQM